jgi:protein-S-isoprenylcysteine O-methyltransferase Ste14
MLRRVWILIYGVVAYGLFLATSLYACGFVGNFRTPTALDGALQGPFAPALAIDLGLLALFAVQHSGMARPGFKRWLTRFVPQPMERPTYVLLSSVALLLLFWLWRPLGGVVWEVTGAPRVVLYSLFAAGWLTVLGTTFLINHFDLFGLRQAWLGFRGLPYTPLKFTTPGPYKLVRHPLYVGWLLAFWATPTMTTAHLVFALGTTAYILGAILLEERDLVAAHPEYARYQQEVPMLVPRLNGLKREAGARLPDTGPERAT